MHYQQEDEDAALMAAIEESKKDMNEPPKAAPDLRDMERAIALSRG